ncbi:MAG: heavy-metal-associated domain-containing protein [Firmicutes bacterium]|jgi:copper chaperone CopZ|nr:heavy-metal-associated domain-containing protein [Bacillota bacterium]
MKKVMQLSGLTCAHCQKRVENALNAIDGVSAQINLEKQQAVVKLSKAVDDQVLRTAVEEAGYEVLSISEKKGLFGL